MIIYNKLLPLKGYIAINLFTIIFARSEYKPINNNIINHEQIHTKQQIELLFIGFYLWYIIEYIINIFKYKFNLNNAYYNIRFEKEAYNNEKNTNYINNRKHYNWIKL